MKFVRREQNKIGRISMLNLIDVIFVLLLFFMLTTTFNKLTHFNVNLPQTTTEFEKDNNLPVELFYEINEKITLKIGEIEQILSIDALKNFISNLDENHKNSIKISADEGLEYKKIIDLISILKDANVNNVELNIRKN
ncbi:MULTISPECIES: ExbD/TolR family protein [Campylobacter]|uniref:Biopolymer transporter ExbD n=1 Tax=Campylobacter porcelli TaxID=1660073 RepID=A0A1X9SYH2_9BACT|nr:MULTISPECIES: biopolymer transporter ExbD [unclassified Campylobacter]MCR8678768.1 biopolymer transporter ExbD [Campylobacter sp. RM19072]MCR8696271.1 biopolymer transporter ExbD [Campylobacter sp. RM19073]MEE3705497.1 biopolymer transporter ExbD [Campylobacter sp. CX2-8023-23]MEE3744210.1 biopolymer transporter ExbD [Campylobacter sp. CX2-4855-23]ARR01352.1 TonB system transport protein ExbD [Campylobacter sp. RM6137]